MATWARQQNARANRDAAAWQRRCERRICRQQAAARPPPAPKARPLPRFAAGHMWDGRGARDFVLALERAEAGPE